MDPFWPPRPGGRNTSRATAGWVGDLSRQQPGSGWRLVVFGRESDGGPKELLVLSDEGYNVMGGLVKFLE